LHLTKSIEKVGKQVAVCNNHIKLFIWINIHANGGVRSCPL